MKDKKFTFFESYHKALSRLSDEHYGRIVRAISKFVFDGEEPDFSEDTDWVIWELTKPIIERGFEISNARKEANLSRRSFSGGAPLGNRNSAKQQQTTTKQQQTTTDKEEDKDNEMEEDKETEHILFKKNNMKKPTVEEVQSYFFEQAPDSSRVDALEFYDFYESNGWKVGKNPMKDWKAAVRNWVRNKNKNHYGNNSTISKEQQERDYLRKSAEYLANISPDGAEESF